MRIYLKNNDEFKSNVGPTAISNHSLIGENVYCFNSGPFLDLTDDFDILKQIEILPKVFLKATIVAPVKYYTGREFGVYAYGKAKAELISTEKSYYFIKIETSDWDGIPDMKILQEKIWAGTIMPNVSYVNKQVKNHLLAILNQLLDSRNLNKIQRFFLALRLTRQKI